LESLCGPYQPATKADVQALSSVLAELVALLQPPSAVILTGAEVERAFADLRGKPKTAAQMRYALLAMKSLSGEPPCSTERCTTSIRRLHRNEA
jgi:uracil-DNA glycosylase